MVEFESVGDSFPYDGGRDRGEMARSTDIVLLAPLFFSPVEGEKVRKCWRVRRA